MVWVVNAVLIVLKPLEVNWVAKEFPDISLTPVPILILYMVLEKWLVEDVTVNVLLELDTDGDEFIWIQVLKLSVDTWRVPEQDVPDEFAVTEVVSIDSEKVTEMVESMDPVVSESAGEVEETVGAIVSSLKA